MNRPVMGGEQTNVPKNAEEHAAAMKKKQVADAVEEATHQAARSGTTIPDAEKIARDAIEQHMKQVQQLMYMQQQVTYDLASAVGTVSQHVNAILYAAAVCIGSVNEKEEVPKMLEYIAKESERIRLSHEAKRANLDAVQPKGQA